MQWVSMITHGRHENVAGFVIRRIPLVVLREEHGFALRSHHDFVLRELKVELVHRFTVGTRSIQRGFVHHVGQIGAGESWSTTGQDPEVDIFRQRYLLGVNAEHFLAPAYVGPAHNHPAVEATGTEQGGIEHVGAVGGSDQNDAVVGLKTVHLNQQLIQGLLPLIVAAAKTGAAMTSNGIDFVDEDDAGGILFSLFEQITYPAGADADEHLDKVGTGNGKERDVGFTRNGTGQEGLAGAWRSNQKDALGDPATQLLELLRLAQEFDDLLQLFLGLIHAGHVS